MVSPAVLENISQKCQFRQNSCSDIILQYLMELCQEVSQVLTAESLGSEIWDLAPFSSKWMCKCFRLAGSIQVVCSRLFGFLQSVPQSLCLSSANHAVCMKYCARQISNIMTPLCSPFSFLLGLIPKSSFSTHISLAAFSMTAFSVNQLYTVVEPVGVFILCLCLLKSIPQQHHPYHQPCFGLIQILLQCLPSHFNHVLKNSPL